MAAEKDNLYAEKWGEAEVLAMLKKIKTEAKKPSCVYLGSALVKVDLYKEIWAYWRKKFKSNPQVFQLVRQIEQIFENRLYTGSLTGKYNASIAKLGLSHHHGMIERTQTDVTTAGKPITAPQTLDLSKATDEELDQLEKLATRLGGDKARKGKA